MINDNKKEDIKKNIINKNRRHIKLELQLNYVIMR